MHVVTCHVVHVWKQGPNLYEKERVIMAKERFEEVYIQGKLNVTKIIRDNGTGVLYMLNQTRYNAGLTVLVDQEGNPLVDKEYKS